MRGEYHAPGGFPGRRMQYDVIPSVVYSIPEVVSVGQAPLESSEVRSIERS